MPMLVGMNDNLPTKPISAAKVNNIDLDLDHRSSGKKEATILRRQSTKFLHKQQ
jgi:hypothetical protein